MSVSCILCKSCLTSPQTPNNRGGSMNSLKGGGACRVPEKAEKRQKQNIKSKVNPALYEMNTDRRDR